MNNGILTGLNKPDKRQYYPQIHTVNDTGVGLTQPINIGEPGRNNGIWTYLDPNTVIVWLHMNHSYLIPEGTGPAYVVELPVPAKRWGGNNSIVASQVIGGGKIIDFFHQPYSQHEAVATLADQSWFNVAGEANKYFQVFIEKTLKMGTATIVAGNTSVTVTHDLPYTPVASDIQVTFTNGVVSNNGQGLYYIDNITSTTFDVNIDQKAGTTVPSLAQARADGVSGGTTVTATLGSSPTAGNILVAVVGCNAAAASVNMTTPGTGWTIIEQVAGSANNTINVFARVVAGGESATYTATGTGASVMGMQVYEIQNAASTVAAAIPAANHGSQGNASSTSGSTPTLTPTAGVSTYGIAGVWWSGGTTSAQSINSGFSLHVASNNRQASADLVINPTTGSYAPTFSWTGSRVSSTALALVQGSNGMTFSWTVKETPNFANGGIGSNLYSPLKPLRLGLPMELEVRLIYEVDN